MHNVFFRSVIFATLLFMMNFPLMEKCMFIFYLLFFLVSYFLSSVSRQMWFLLRPIVVHQNEIQKSTQKKTGRGVVNFFLSEWAWPKLK